MATRWARVARGLIAALFSLFVAAFSHVVSGGTQPTPFAVVACLVLATFVCVALAAKKLSVPRLALSVAASQFLFHGIFSLWSSAPMAVEAGRQITHGHMVAALTSVPVPDAVMAMGGAGMWLGHAVAAVITIAVLRHGELVFWGLLDTARLWVGAILFRAPSAPVPFDARPSLSRSERVFLRRDLALLLSPMRHRGPPARGVRLAPA